MTTIGLIFNATGAFLLIFFPFPGLNISKTGEVGMILTGGSITDKQRAVNKWKYKKYWWGSKAGVVFLVVGFVLQLVDTICK
jgi:hypothetical protein